MKQLFLMLIVASSSFAFTQDAVEYKYEPEVNKAEYYIGSYNKNKDLDDLVDWYEDFAQWTTKQGTTYDLMTVGLLTPYFSFNGLYSTFNSCAIFNMPVLPPGGH